MHLLEGSLLGGGKYRIEKVLGQGGFGITYLAQQTSLGRKVALKEFFMEGLCNRDSVTSHVSVPSVGSRKLVERFRQKFIKEARTIASFSNAHIISIYDVFEDNSTAYYVMEYLDGKNLAAMVNGQGVMSETVAIKYIRQVADALVEVHASNLLHLDVKPTNIMLNKKGEVVLIDFGISKHYDEAGMQTSSALIGTSEGYAPLEQYEAGALDCFTPATDIYALGATLFFLLTGQRPPKASEVMNYGLPGLPSDISPKVHDAVVAAMQPAVRMRPQSIGEFLSLLSESGNVKAESGKRDDGETELNGKQPAIIPLGNFSTPRGKVSRFDGSEKSQSADNVILNECEKSHFVNKEILPSYSRYNDKDGKEKGKKIWIILLLLLVAVGGVSWYIVNVNDSVSKVRRNDSITRPKVSIPRKESKVNGAQDTLRGENGDLKVDVSNHSGTSDGKKEELKEDNKKKNEDDDKTDDDKSRGNDSDNKKEEPKDNNDEQMIQVNKNVPNNDSNNEPLEIVEVEDIFVDEDIDEDNIFMPSGDAPQFPGGSIMLNEFLKKELKYPTVSLNSGSQGCAVVSFTVEKDGSITDVNILKTSGDELLDAEAVRVVKIMPKWNPGKQNGIPLKIGLNIPISFKLK